MGQFKPMVKMETTEPSVELKLKKGGKVAKKADGGMMGSPMSAAGAMPLPMPARGGMMGAKAPMKPSLAMRRRAMRGRPSGAGPAGPVGGAAQMQPSMPSAMPPPMKKGGKADTAQDKAMVKKAFKQHDMQEHKGGKGTKLALKKGGKMATGGVVNGQGGFATGGVVKGQGGYATGGVAKSNGGGYKKGGAPKKAYAAGGTVNSGRPVAMPQGNKKPSQPVSINQLSGTFKKGGKVRKMAEGGSLDPISTPYPIVEPDTGGVMIVDPRDMDYAERELELQSKYAAQSMPDFSQDPGLQEVRLEPPRIPDTMNDYDQALRLNTDQRREAQSQYYDQGNVDSYSRPQSIEFPFDSSRQRLQPLELHGSRTPMQGDGRPPPMVGHVDETGRGYGSYLPEPLVPPYYARAYKAGGKVARSKRMADGGSSSAQDKYMLKDPKAVSDKASQELEEALNPLSMAKELYGKAKNYLMPKGSVTESERKILGNTTKPKSVTKTKESVTVTPAKKRGGMVKC